MGTSAPCRQFHTHVVITDSAGLERGHGCLVAPQAVLVHAPLSSELARLKRDAEADSPSGLRAILSAATNGPQLPPESIEVVAIDVTRTAEGDPVVALDLGQPSGHLPDQPPRPYPKIADDITDLYRDKPELADDIIGLYREMLQRHLSDTPPDDQIHDEGSSDLTDFARNAICKIFKNLKWCKKK